jgi:hypothetical protein
VLAVHLVDLVFHEAHRVFGELQNHVHPVELDWVKRLALLALAGVVFLCVEESDRVGPLGAAIGVGVHRLARSDGAFS